MTVSGCSETSLKLPNMCKIYNWVITLYSRHKVIVSALIVAAVTAVAKHHPGVGGWIAALPIVSILSAIWLVSGNQSSLEVIRFLTGVLKGKGLVPTAILFVIVIVFLKRGWPFIGALGMAFTVWGASSFLMQRVGL